MKERAGVYIKIVCDYLHLPVDLVISKSRKHELCEARQVISFILLMHTKLSLYQIAIKLNYKSHASPWRDYRQVSFFLDHDKQFSFKINPLLEKCKYKAREFERKDKALKGDDLPVQGDTCWFWNLWSKLPLIGTLDRIYHDENKELRFVRRESPIFSFSHCIYAGDYIIPEKFSSTTADKPETITA